jgi:chromosome segregation ATPase
LDGAVSRADARRRGGPGRTGPPADVATELARVNATLKEIAALLNRQSDMQSIDLLMKRVQLAQSQVTELEGRIRTDESELRGLENQSNSLEMRLKTLRAQEEQNGANQPPINFQAFSAQTAIDLQLIRQRIGQLHQEIAAF